MERNLVDALHKTVELAKKLAEAIKELDASLSDFEPTLDLYIENQDTPEYKKCDQIEHELRLYLLSLDDELVNDIRSIMLLGREQEYDIEASYEERFASQRKCLRYLDGDEKSSTVEYIIDKAPLVEYLHDGMKILGLI